uniref:Phosphatidylinositol glycan, class Q n=1 Tax=Kwoniella pini CBS 10737 TaxID=1296096 RepID=A0A1B9I5H6_9TREE|nr:uncharacterized protein I206_02812 [Kwoniella pini CBS 10737]OCF50756.1 hypothetical protein I206_02812 [Kwoniella pini CBS 10737]
MRIFWPKTGIDKSQGLVVGWELQDTLCVVTIVDKWSFRHETSGTVPKLQVLGSVDSRHRVDITSISADTKLKFWLNKDQIPILCSEPISLIIYTPPDPSRLRFLRSPPSAKAKRNDHLAVQDEYSIGMRLPDVINTSYLAQESLSSQNGYVPKLSKSKTVSQQAFVQISSTIWSTMCELVLWLILPINLCARAISGACEYNTSFGKVRDFSTTIKQVSLRLSQGLEGPERFRSTHTVSDIELKSDQYIRFWNTVWLIFNDIILGYSARQFILAYSPFIQDIIPEVFSKYLIDSPITVLKWLNDWPVGLKLNTPLSQFFCTALGILIRNWGDTVEPMLLRILPLSLQMFAFFSLFGLTFTIAILKDSVSILTSHLYICHTIMTYIFNWQLESLGGLWNLFRGKRWNVLRKRTDSYEYDVDQLFLGTLLFTVSAFLFPTVLTYFGVFALIRFGIVTSQRVLSAALTSLNAFPLFELMLRLKEPSRLPAGIHFRLRRIKDGGVVGDPKDMIRITHSLELENSPKSILDILFPHS